VGTVVYPVPPFVIVKPVICVVVNDLFAVIAAPVPPPPVIVTIGFTT